MSWDADIIGTGAGPFDTEAFMEGFRAAYDVKPVYFSSENGRPLCSGYVHTRLLLRKRLYLNNILYLEKSTFDKIREYAKTRGIGTILSSMFTQWDYDAEKYGLIKKYATCTSVIDLTKPEEELLRSMKKPFRNAISKAMRSGITVKQSDDYDAFYELYIESHKEVEKDGEDITPLSRQRYNDMLSPLARSGFAKFFVAEKDGMMLNGAIIACFNGKALYWHGGMRQEDKNLGGGNMLHWEIIRYFKAAGFASYDLGGIAIDPEIGMHKKGVNNFKEAMGGAMKEYYMGQVKI